MSNSCDSDAEHGINVARAISDRQSMQKTGGLVERHADGVRYVGGRIAGMLGVLFVLVGMILTLQSPDRVLLIWAGLFLLVGIPAALIWLDNRSQSATASRQTTKETQC